jgi:hypothetical protein
MILHLMRLAYEIFHEHITLNEHEMKERIKEKLDDDEFCVRILQKSEQKGVNFDELWNKKIYSSVSNL